MRQIVQDVRNGKTLLEEVPIPLVKEGNILIKTTCSLVSIGTERMLVEFGRAGIIRKTYLQPEKVQQVIEKIQTEGVLSTLETVYHKINQPIPLGYCNVGTVIEVGKGVYDFNVGDRVASNGSHAEYVCVPEKLAAKIPDNVSDEEACFSIIGSIGLQGIRLCKPEFGESIIVIGLGLVGLITAELLKLNGCKVIGYDLDDKKVAIASSKGITAFNPKYGTDPVRFVRQATHEVGADAVIIAASSTSDKIIHQAAEMCRKRGRIILIGVVGLNINRSDFYEKELKFQVSCSYGPGRYDENYEQKNHDYPIAYVRWTEKRNFEAVLQAISEGKLEVKSLITEMVNLDDFDKIYDNIQKSSSIASIIIYPNNKSEESIRNVVISKNHFDHRNGIFGIIGAGNFVSSIVIPKMKVAKAEIKYIASEKGLSAKIVAKKGNISIATSDYKEILNDNEVDTVIIATRHNLHAKMVIEAIRSGKNVFVEKPLCLNENELNEIIKAYNDNNSQMLVVGFNRRFSRLAQKMKSLLGEGSKNIIVNMNAGYVSKDSWLNSIEIGGGRIIGEACHLIDLCTYLCSSKVKSVCANYLGDSPQEDAENASILLRYENGSNAVINYFANGNKRYSKERIEAYFQGKTIIIDNWRILKAYGVPGFSKMRTKLDKGHQREFCLLVHSIKTGQQIIPIDEIINTTKASFAVIKSIKENRWVEIY